MDDESIKRIRSDEEGIHNKIRLVTVLVWTLVALGLLVGLHGVYVYVFQAEFKLAGLGDYLGGSVASLWSLAGLFLIYLAFLGQRLQLLGQQEELILNRQELQATRREFEQQNATLRKQNFENTFFHLLKLHQDNVQSLRVPSLGQNYVGQAAFKGLYHQFATHHKSANVPDADGHKKKILTAYRNFFAAYQSEVGHYFRGLYNIIKIINLSELTDGEKRIYANLVRAQLSSDELLLLFYNCLSEVGEKFYPLAEEYNLLKTTPTRQLLDKQHKDLYPQTTFNFN
ncbi:MAG: putative phage abortive infection protein [Ignavibacteriae bacterium]|nr:putative phage abortive infection protein [Ignavibacteriota bacterium]